MGHRRWLEQSHPFQFKKDDFDGSVELRSAPTTPSGTDTLRQLEGISFQYGKGAKSSKKRAREEVRNVINEELVEKDNNTSQVAVFEDADDFINDPHNLDQDGVPKMAENNCPEEIIAIARGPNNVAKRYSGFVINGFRFHTKNHEKLRKTQNSGVMVEAEGQDSYGKLTDIFELDYYGSFKVVFFRCEWVDIRSPRGMKKDTNGFVLVNFSKLMHTGQLLKDDPFIFSSQAKQVFYIQDVKNEEWSYVLITKPRDLYDMGTTLQGEDDDDQTYTQCMPFNVIDANELDNCASWARTDIEGENSL
uniref:DUF4216 domain-containing protein n=1 Tax=Ananas comosus var. bracteatus TaxID=296719 RepID=A0A6V7QLP8_ANACO|nr:unnamed protein product [Ananas comosus var. bracteatus]